VEALEVHGEGLSVAVRHIGVSDEYFNTPIQQ